MLKYGIIGTGAVGGFYGAKLAHAGKDVHFLFHSDYEYVSQHGLQVNSVDGHFLLKPVQLYHQAIDMPKCDVVIVCLKTINNHLLKDILPPLLQPETVVVMLQNGLGMEADLQQVFPDTEIVGGVAVVCISKLKPGLVTHIDYGHLSLGQFSRKNSHTIDAIVSDFRDAGVDAEVVDLAEARWGKLINNIPLNGLTTLFGVTTDQLLAYPSTEKLAYEMMCEVFRAARRVGVTSLADDYVDYIMQRGKDMKPYASSTKIDRDNHRPMELDYMFTRPIVEAQSVGVVMPKCAMLEAELRYIQHLYL